MKAACYYGKEDIRVERVPDPQILNPRDAIVKVTTTAICGSDLHIYDGYIPTMERGDILGHEFMGEVVEVGRGNDRLKVGDRVVVPFTIACGHCYFCHKQLWSLCDNSNPNAALAEKLAGYSGSGLFGYSHIYGGYPGGQAEYARVPFSDIGPIKVPDSLSDEQLDPSRYRDVHRETLTALIDAKATGRPRTQAGEAGEVPLDLLSALRASIEAAKQRRSTGNGGRRRVPASSRTANRKPKKPAQAGREASPPKKRG